MKTYKEFVLNESVAKFLVKSVARHLMRSKGTAKKITQSATQSATQTPKQLKYSKVFHGTNTPASAAISKGGYRTDKNVSRQMLGKGVYTSPDNYTAAMYAHRAANNFGGEPTLRQLRVPQDVAKKQTTKVYSGTGDYSGKGYKMTTLSSQQANKYDVTDKIPKSKYNFDMMMSPENKRDLRLRVRRALRNPANRRYVRGEIESGNRASLENRLKYRYRNVGKGRKERIY